MNRRAIDNASSIYILKFNFNCVIVKSLKEFITEHLENTPIAIVEENQEQATEKYIRKN